MRTTLEVSERADFRVGYFNLRGWKQLDHLVDRWTGGEGACCRLMVGMQKLPNEELRAAFPLIGNDESVGQRKVLQLKTEMAEGFRAAEDWPEGRGQFLGSTRRNRERTGVEAMSLFTTMGSSSNLIQIALMVLIDGVAFSLLCYGGWTIGRGAPRWWRGIVFLVGGLLELLITFALETRLLWGGAMSCLVLLLCIFGNKVPGSQPTC